MEDPRKESELESEYMYRIIKSWRSKFPKSSVTDENLLRRIHDLIYNPTEDLETVTPKKSKKSKIEPQENQNLDNLRFDEFFQLCSKFGGKFEFLKFPKFLNFQIGGKLE